MQPYFDAEKLLPQLDSQIQGLGRGTLCGAIALRLDGGLRKDVRGNPLFILAVCAPGISAIIVSGLIAGPAGIRQLLDGFLRWRIGIQWSFAILVAIPMLSAIAMLLSAAAQRRTGHLAVGESLSQKETYG